MCPPFIRVTQLTRSASTLDISHVVQAIGTKHFDQELASLLRTNSGVERYFTATFAGKQPKCISAVHPAITLANIRALLEKRRWHLDPLIEQAREAVNREEPVIIQFDATALPVGQLRNFYRRIGIIERLAIWSLRGGLRIGIEVAASRQQGRFSTDEVAWLQMSASTLLSTLRKHVEIANRDARQISLKSLGAIEEIIPECTDILPRREAQVCARILYGLSTAGIAIDVGIGEETAATYRKRAFRRLGISTPRELLLWYLAL